MTHRARFQFEPATLAEVKSFVRAERLWQDDGFAFDCGLGNAEIGHDTQYFPQNGFSVSGKPPAGKLDRDAEYRYLYGQTR